VTEYPAAIEVTQLRPHLWRWTAPHPDWRPESAENDGWEQEVAGTAIVRGDEFVLIDPQAPTEGEERDSFWRAVDADVEHHGPPHIVLTVPWHVRSSAEIAKRYERTTLWVYEDAPKEEGVEPTNTFGLVDELPAGMRAFQSGWFNEVELWIPEHGALVTGDVILGASGGGLRLLPDSWLPEGGSRADVVEALAPLRDLPVELVLPAHGQPVLSDGAKALQRALDA
jgi:glyoxylase-like metal-dependent hydrolase (beta-lactamase superfamily II)